MRNVRIELENKKAAEEPPKKKRRRFGGVEAEDMTLVTPVNAAQRPGWKVSALGRITKPVKMRPAHPLPEMVEEKSKVKPGVVKFTDVGKPLGETEKKKKKRVKDPDSRARRKAIDMTKYGSTHLKGMFLDLEVPMPTNRPARYQDKRYDEDLEDNDGDNSSGSEAEATSSEPPKVKDKASKRKTSIAEPVVELLESRSKITSPAPPPLVQVPEPVLSPSNKGTSPPVSSKKISSPTPPPLTTSTILSKATLSTVSENNADIQQEKLQSLNLLNSLFGDADDDWVGQEEIDSDIDVSELVKGDRILVDENIDFEIVPRNASTKNVSRAAQPDGESGSEVDDDPQNAENMEVDQATASVQDSKPKTLKDLFAPREEEGDYLFCLMLIVDLTDHIFSLQVGFSLLGHLDLDLELDEDPLAAQDAVQQPHELHESHPAPLPAPITVQTHPSHAPMVLDPRQALFFPLPKVAGSMNRARQRDVYDLAKDNGWNWRDPAVGFYQTGTEEDIRKRWEDSKGELTRDWKRRCREAGKVNRRRRGGVDGGDEL